MDKHNKHHIFLMNVLLLLILFFNTTSCFGTELSHPPTFEQIKQSWMKCYTDDGFAYSMLVTQALKYTEDDINILRKQNKIEYIIGAAYQAGRHEGIQLLINYMQDVRNNPVGLSLLLSYALQNDAQTSLLNLEKLTDSFLKSEPANSFPYYLKACYYEKINKPDLCYYYMKEGNRQKIFNNYFKELSNISIKTSLFLGYSKIAAQTHALGLQHDVFIYRTFTGYLMNKNPVNETFLQCQKTGEILGRNSTAYLSDILANAIRKKALENLQTGEFVEKLKQVESEKKYIQKMINLLYSVSETYEIPEQRWIQYYDDLYCYSENYAIQKLLKEYPVTDGSGAIHDCR